MISAGNGGIKVRIFPLDVDSFQRIGSRVHLLSGTIGDLTGHGNKKATDKNQWLLRS